MSGEHEESEDSSTDKQLINRLAENGLEPEYWLNEIKKLGIKNINALQYVQADDCSNLENKIRYPWEKGALRKLFKIPESSVISAKVQEKQAEVLKQRNEQASKILEQLKVLISEKKSLQDKVVLREVEEMQKFLEIPPGSSVPPDKSLKDLVDYFERQNSLRIEASLKANHYTDEEVMKHSSGGLALKGIYYTRNTEDCIEIKEPLLCVPQDIHLLGPQQSSFLSQKEFTSHEEETIYKEIIEQHGFSFSSSFGFSFKRFNLGIGIDISKSSSSKVSTSSSKDHTFVCTTRYNYVPLASYYFTNDQLRLSDNALKKLKEMETLICMNSDLTGECKNFFQRFGSHANLGPIHFGGIFWWKAAMEGVHRNEIHEAKTSIKEALNTFMNCSYSGITSDVAISNTNTQGSVDKSKTTQLEKTIRLSTNKTGGPAEADSLPHWKAGLVTSNRSWSVIDRGFQLIPVWKIIMENHKNEFKDVTKLSSCLLDSYKLLTGLSSEVMVGEKLLLAMDTAQPFLEDVKSWDTENTKNHLNDLLEFKKKIKDLTKSDSPWVNVCLSDKSLQSFLVKVTEKYKADISIDTDIIKALMQEIIEPHIYSAEDFPGASVLMKWIYDSEKDKLDDIDIQKFTQLSKVLQKSIDDILHVTVDLNSSKEEVNQTKVLATLNISLSIYSFVRILRQTGQTDIELLILCIANNYGYCVENYNFRLLLGHREIQFLKDQLQEAYEECIDLRKQCNKRAQAFVLYTGLTSMGQYKEIPSQRKTEHLNFMLKHLGNALSPDVDNIVNKSSGNWEDMEGNLRAFSNGFSPYKEVPAQEFVKQLSHLIEEEKTSTEQNDDVDVRNTREDVLMLLKSLDLEKYYPQKMKTADFHKISKATLSGAKPSENRELPIDFLQKLLVSDYGARYVHCENKGERSDTRTNNSDHTIGSSGDNVIQNFFGGKGKGTEKQNAKQVQHIHPMDVQMAIFHCADDFMRQYIYTKLSFCQIALPLLVPNPNTRSIEFPLWAFQEIKKNWVIKHGNEKEKSISNDKFIKVTETPIVSFIRLGPSAFSKSKTINWLMSKHRHNIFYHRDCEGSTKHSVLMDGVTEIAWYCPGGREDDAFDDCIAFVNLHGDARDHDQQLEFILEISSVLVLILTDNDVNDSKSANMLNQLLPSTKLCAFLLVDEESSGSHNRRKLKIGIKGRNEAELIKEVRTKIQELLSVQKEVNSLDKCAALARRRGFVVDEDKDQCRVGKEQAEKLLDLLKKEDLKESKKKFLPLQGDPWQKWCKRDKQLKRLKGKINKTIEEEKCEIESKKEALRREQREKTNPLNDFMKNFLQFLYSNDQRLKMYFLQWLKLYLDDLSSEALSGLNQKYHHLWSSVKNEKQGGKNKENIEHMENELQELLSKINFSSFGLEHVVRELGQIYEALEANAPDEIISSLPKIAANLLISGYPIELMDGDTAHVPLKWITAILHELKNTLGDKTLFVLSVLGVQSTGKSTLLNAMFGLKFAVGAGRCTRGAFMQLVKIEEEFQNELTYDYVLVVDTEGLRSTELSSQNTLNRDNELATFVIGLGNVTLINIFGENPSEMQDILQIAVQAFLRMKRVKLHPSCFFVHQNVEEITAKEKNREGQRCLESKLDEMTKCAAQQEDCDAAYFSDVIQFHVSNIYYFSHLWEGDPPMAPPNRRYSQNVRSLREVILKSGKGRDGILSISAFSTRVNDLWNALLNENFVFSFRNSLVIAAYSKLEVKYSEWAWRLREQKLTIQYEIINQIRQKENESTEITGIAERLDEVYKTVQEEIKDFFNEDKDKNTLVQWREETQIKIDSLKNNLTAEMEEKAKELLSLREKNRDIDCMKAQYENKFFAECKELSKSLKGKPLSDEALEEKFCKLWNIWIMEVAINVPPPDSPEIHRDLDEILQEQFKTEVNITNTICDSKKWVNLKDEFFNVVAKKMRDSRTLREDEKKITDSVIALKKKIDEYIGKRELEKMDYQSSYFHEILQIICEEITKKFGQNFKFGSDYILCASLFLCREAADRFEELSVAYRKATYPLLYLESKRDEFYMSFKVSCKGKLEAASLADIISNKLQVPLQHAVCEKSAIEASTDMKCNHPAMNGNRSKVELYLLKSLAEKEDFQKYLTFFTDPKSAVKEFVEECIGDYMNTTKMSGFFRINLETFKKIVLDAVNLSTIKIKKEKGNVDSWLDTFCSQLGSKLNLSRNDLKSLKYQDITQIDFLKEAMTRAVDTVVEKFQEELVTDAYYMTRLKNRIIEILFGDFPGCWEQCPFCGAVCTNTIPDHDTDHSVQYHRPAGYTGRYKWELTSQLRTDICTTLITTAKWFQSGFGKPMPYHSYRKGGEPYSKWTITPDDSSLCYWKWVTCRFQSDIEKHHAKRFERIPAEWKEVTIDQAIAEIENLLHP